MKPVIYIWLNKRLQMTSGKAASQAAHAAVMAVINSTQEMKSHWEDSAHKTIVVLEGKDENHLKNSKEYLEQRGFHLIEIIDEGVNEIEPHSWTAMATQILNKEESFTSESMSNFRFYREKVRIKMEVDV